ncbi:hypothetical protein H2277_04120 [Campylobacter sp. W0014]|uniref:hypothetical protein n=1 Tax=Campylobacter sp. W0014 TaxID=2735781 RepID=UPI001EC80D49|nr:hypothetical protein [Campylobacter sp. W0014]
MLTLTEPPLSMVKVLPVPLTVILSVLLPFMVQFPLLQSPPLIVALAQVAKTETAAKENRNFLERDLEFKFSFEFKKRFKELKFSKSPPPVVD